MKKIKIKTKIFFIIALVVVITGIVFILWPHAPQVPVILPPSGVVIPQAPAIQPSQETPAIAEAVEETIITKEPVLTDLEREIYNLVNEVRIGNGLTALKINEKLVEAARSHAQDMVEKNYFSHNTPYGKRFTGWIEETGYRFSYVGENLARNYQSAYGTVEGWLASETHYENIIHKHYTETGVGVVDNFSVQLFATPE